jgi:hypothetical protein
MRGGPGPARRARLARTSACRNRATAPGRSASEQPQRRTGRAAQEAATRDGMGCRTHVTVSPRLVLALSSRGPPSSDHLQYKHFGTRLENWGEHAVSRRSSRPARPGGCGTGATPSPAPTAFAATRSGADADAAESPGPLPPGGARGRSAGEFPTACGGCAGDGRCAGETVSSPLVVRFSQKEWIGSVGRGGPCMVGALPSSNCVEEGGTS